MYADATKRHLAAPQQQSPSIGLQYPPQHHPSTFQPDPRAAPHLPYQSQPSNPIHYQSHGVPFNGQQILPQLQNQHAHQHQLPPTSQPQMQHFNGYNLSDAGSMPPPSTMGAMGMNVGATMQQGMPQQRNPQSYQAHMRNNSQQMPPSSPGILQSPTSYTTPTPPSGATATGQPFVTQPIASPTKQLPPTSTPSQPPMTTASPNSSSPQPPKGQKSPFSEQPMTESQKADNRKVELVLEINRFLLQEVVQLQAIGKGVIPPKQGSDVQSQAGGQQSPTSPEAVKDGSTTESKDALQPEADVKSDDGTKKPTTSRECIECMRRLQANFAFLTNVVSRSSKPQQQIIERPPIMEPIPTNIENNAISDESMATSRELYKQLKELWPHPPPPPAPPAVVYNPLQDANHGENKQQRVFQKKPGSWPVAATTTAGGAPNTQATTAGPAPAVTSTGAAPQVARPQGGTVNPSIGAGVGGGGAI